jgi:nucleotide-binding universal stress UspA family protein
MKIEKILTGIDFGPSTEKVFAYSSFFAEVLGASLNLLHVIDYIVTPPAYLAPYIKEEKKVAEKKFAALEKRLRASGIKAETKVISGRLHESFNAMVEKINADMLVLGFMSHVLRRSSSEKLIKGLQMPMLVVRGEKAESARMDSIKIRRILCPTDFSEASKKALKVANDLKDIFSAEMDVIHVLPNHIIKIKIEKVRDRDRVLQELNDEARDNLNNLLSNYDIEKSGVIEEGEPDKKIISFSKEKDIDLIVMGARGLGLMKGMIIGSVTDAVLKSSPCPVLVIH